MKDLVIRLKSVAEVQNLARLAVQEPYSIVVTDGEQVINAESFMCMFCLDFRKPLVLRMDCTDEEFERFRLKAESIGN